MFAGAFRLMPPTPAVLVIPGLVRKSELQKRHLIAAASMFSPQYGQAFEWLDPSKAWMGVAVSFTAGDRVPQWLQNGLASLISAPQFEQARVLIRSRFFPAD